MADHPLQVAADRFVLRMADVVLDSVGAAREAVDLGRLESALARRDVDGAVFALEAAVDAAERVLTGATKPKAAEDTDPERGLEAVIAETVAAGGNAVDLCVAGRSVPVQTHDAPAPLAARATRAIETELRRLQDEFGIDPDIKRIDLFPDQGLALDPQTGKVVGSKTGGASGVFDPQTKSITLALQRDYMDPIVLARGPNTWNVDDSFHGTMRHEIGHGIMRTLETSDLMEWYGLHAQAHRGRVPISQYGATNAHEGFAEMWSAYTHPEFEARFFDHVPDIVGFFERVFPRRK